MITEPSNQEALLLEAQDLWVEFDGNTVLRGVNFGIRSGESRAIVGGSHSGKSVLLKALAGLIRPSKGRVLFQGKRVGSFDNLSVPWDDHLGYVSQYLGLRSNMTALENTSLPLLYHDVIPGKRAEEKSTFLLEQLGIGDVSLRPAMMSPGERSLVALARALIIDPTVVLLDNPVVVLDVDYSERVINIMEERRREGLAVVSACSSDAVAKLLTKDIRRIRDGIMEDLA